MCPLLLVRFSAVTLLVHGLGAWEGLSVRQASWYQKAQPTFTDALAEVGKARWSQAHFPMSPPKPR
jgi:hypothetical protein